MNICRGITSMPLHGTWHPALHGQCVRGTEHAETDFTLVAVIRGLVNKGITETHAFCTSSQGSFAFRRCKHRSPIYPIRPMSKWRAMNQRTVAEPIHGGALASPFQRRTAEAKAAVLVYCACEELITA